MNTLKVINDMLVIDAILDKVGDDHDYEFEGIRNDLFMIEFPVMNGYKPEISYIDSIIETIRKYPPMIQLELKSVPEYMESIRKEVQG